MMGKQIVVVLLSVLLHLSCHVDGDKVDDMKTACGTSMNCLKEPPSCDIKVDCTSAAAYKVEGTDLLIDLMLNSTEVDKYVAIGFSTDGKMSSVLATACVAVGADMKAEFYWMNAYSPEKQNAGADISLESSEQLEGLIYCRIKQKLAMSVLTGEKALDLTSGNFTVHLASGLYDKAASSVKKHTDTPTASMMPVDVTATTSDILNEPEPEAEPETTTEAPGEGARMSMSLSLIGVAAIAALIH